MAATFPPQEPPSSQPPGGLPPAPPPPPSPPPQQPLPWEQSGYPALEGLYETAKLFITAPSQAFARMSLSADLMKPLLYAVIFGWVGIIAGQAYSLAFRGMMHNLMAPFAKGPQFELPMAITIGVMVMAPIFVLIGVFIWSAIVHLFLMMFGGANSGFGGTLRVVCYAGTVQIAQLLPFCGGMVAGIWALVLEIIGLAIAHRTTQGKAAGAVLVPIALCCACAAIIAIAFGAAIVAAISHATGK